MTRPLGTPINEQEINTLSGHPSVENGHSPDENQVSKTSESCSRAKSAPAARVFARSVASSMVLPTTQFFPSVTCTTSEDKEDNSISLCARTSCSWPSIRTR